ncbi:hypothetical protein GGR57DRAFT_23518 [Xylariaceae sp. FL1272]|nr:hypothetical protein GGR57DRAFT_23518 [Xylariaceae sp. FL1272]
MVPSTSMCRQCTRQLGCLSQSSKNTTRRHYVSPLSHMYSSKPLHTSATRPEKIRIRKAKGDSPSESFEHPPSTRSDIPPRAFWQARVQDPKFPHLSAAECYETAKAYVNAAVANTLGWRENLITFEDSPSTSNGGKHSKTISAFTLHYMAIMAMTGGTKQTYWLTTHIFHSLSTLGYVPSLLSFVRTGMRVGQLNTPRFEPTVKAFNHLLDQIGDSKATSRSIDTDFAADACTLRGLMYAKMGTEESDKQALRWFRRAFEVAEDPAKSPEACNETPSGPTMNPNWQWAATFAMNVAEINLKRKGIDKARPWYTFAAEKCDHTPAYFELARILETEGKTDTEEYRKYITKAAVSGHLDAADKLGMLERDRAAEEGLSGWERKKASVFAEELELLVSTSA